MRWQTTPRRTSTTRERLRSSDDARALIKNQPHAVITSADRDGSVWVSFLTGEPGFVDVDGDTIVYPDTDYCSLLPASASIGSALAGNLLQ